jgi:8-oxo-dGTP pyrophosphatase MutT (NUDIX family)
MKKAEREYAMAMEKKRATLALIVSDGKLLLGLKKRDAEMGANTLNGPGGKVDGDETVLACVTRETLEEVGIEINPTENDERAVITFYNGTKSVWEVHIFLIESFVGKPKPTDEMTPDGTWWYDLQALPYITRMLISDGVWMPRVFAGERFTAQVYQNDDATQMDRIEFLNAS